MTSINLTEALAALREGRVVIHPTETCYGLACDMTNPAAVRQLFILKKRPTDKPVSGLFASVEDAKRYVQWNADAERLAADLPGPLTLVLPLRPDAHLFPTPDGGASLGVRVSSHPIAMALATAYGLPVSTTSANLHGQPNPYSVRDIRNQYPEAELRNVVILDGGVLPLNSPSKVIDLTGGEQRILRGK